MRVEIRSVELRRNRKSVLTQVSAELECGQLVGLLGPNGAGKTSLIRILTGVLDATGGAVVASDESGTQLSEREYRTNLGYLPQQFNHPGNFTPMDVLLYVGWLRRVPSQAAERSARELLGEIGLDDVRDTKMRRLSGGMVRRVGIAQALVGDPALVVLDEPTVGLDPDQRIVVRELLTRKAAHSTVVLATHLTEDVAAVASRVIILNRTVLFDGTPAELADLNPDSSAPNALDHAFSAVVAGA